MKSINEDTPFNEAENGAMSTMTAVLGRLATYSGVKIDWDQAFASNKTQFIDPLAWEEPSPLEPLDDGSYAIAVPGQTKVI